MPALEFRENLTYWLSPYINQQSHETGDGDLLPEWMDSSGVQNAAVVQATADNRPTLTADNDARGLWAVEFISDPEALDPAKVLEGPDFDTLVPNNPKTMYLAFRPGNVDDVQDYVSESNRRWLIGVDSGKVRFRNVAGSTTQFLVGPPPVPDTLLIADRWYIAIMALSGTDLYGSVNDPIRMTVQSAGTTLALTALSVGASGPAASAVNPVLSGRVGELLIYNAFHQDYQRAVVFNYLAANWLDRGDPLEQAREPGSRRFVYFGSNRLRAQVDLPPEHMDRDLLEEVHVSHPLGVDPHGAGGGWPLDDSRPLRIAALSEDPDRQIITADLADMRIAQSLWNGFDHVRSGDMRREGQTVVARCARNFNRLRSGWTKQPGGIVIESPPMVELIEDAGVLIDAGSMTQQLLRSSAIDGLTGLTTSGTGTGGSAITVNVALPQLFDFTQSVSFPGETPQSWDFLAGSPHTADLYIQQPTLVGAAANVLFGFSIDHLTITGSGPTPLKWQLQRSVDSFYWNDSTQAWQAGVVWNTIPNTASPLVIERAYFGGITTGGSITDLTLRFGFDSGGTAGRQSRTYHVQLENPAPFPGSRMVTNGASAVTGASRLWFYNGSPQIDAPFNNDCGTFLCRFKPLYTAAEALLDASQLHLFTARHSTDAVATGLIHCYRFYYDGPNGRFAMATKDATTEVTATKTHATVRLTEIALAGRWISLSRDQVGYSAGTLSCFVSGVKGTDAVRSANPTESIDSQIWVGNSPRHRPACGWLTEWRIVPEPWTDQEIYRWSQG